MASAQEIVDAVLDELLDRSGFDGWWGSIDGDIKAELYGDLISSVQAKL